MGLVKWVIATSATALQGARCRTPARRALGQLGFSDCSQLPGELRAASPASDWQPAFHHLPEERITSRDFLAAGQNEVSLRKDFLEDESSQEQASEECSKLAQWLMKGCDINHLS